LRFPIDVTANQDASDKNLTVFATFLFVDWCMDSESGKVVV